MLKNISMSTNVEQAVSKADLVIEAIVENVAVKQKLFAQIEGAAKSDAIITSNTSSLKLSDIGANLKNKKNFGGLHFFNPVPMMKLLEVIAEWIFIIERDVSKILAEIFLQLLLKTKKTVKIGLKPIFAYLTVWKIFNFSSRKFFVVLHS